MIPADDARAYELVRTQGLSYSAAGKRFDPPLPKTTVRAAVTREAVRRAGVAKTGVPDIAPTADAGFMARVLAAGPLPDDDADELAPPAPQPDRSYLEDDDEDPPDLDFGKWIRRHIHKLERHITQLQAEQNEGEAQKYSRTLAVYVAQLRQHEKAERADEGVMTFTLADVEAVRDDLRQKVRDTQHRGLVCAECGRKMRRAEAEGDDE